MYRLFKRVKNWLISPFLIVLLIGALSLFIQMLFTEYYADDFCIGAIKADTLSDIVDSTVKQYMGWGGGLTQTIVVLLMKLGPIVWKIVVVGIYAALVVLSTRLITKDNKKRAIAAFVEWVLLNCISIYLAREVVYWQDGAIAYALTALQAFACFYLLYTRLYLNACKKYDYILFPFMFFFAGWSSVQAGIIAIFSTFVLVCHKIFIKKEKVKVFYWINIVLAVIGFGILYFAPGNNVRMNAGFPDFVKMSLVQKIFYRASGVYGQLFAVDSLEALMIVPFFICLLFGLIAIKARQLKLSNKKVKIVSSICSFVLVLFVGCFVVARLDIPYLSNTARMVFIYKNLLYLNHDSLEFIVACMPFVFVTIAVIASIVNLWIIMSKEKEKNPLLIIVVLSAFLSQYSMLLSPYSPRRTIIYATYYCIVAIILLLYGMRKEKTRILPLVIAILSCIRLDLGILAGLAYLALLYCGGVKIEDHNKDYVVLIGCLALYAIGNWTTTTIMYRANQIQYRENIARIVEFKESGIDCSEQCTLVLLPPVDPIYAWDWFAESDWIEDSVKSYFKLPSNITIQYEEVEGE